jgi:hypothetical protein
MRTGGSDTSGGSDGAGARNRFQRIDILLAKGKQEPGRGNRQSVILSSGVAPPSATAATLAAPSTLLSSQSKSSSDSDDDRSRTLVFLEQCLLDMPKRLPESLRTLPLFVKQGVVAHGFGFQTLPNLREKVALRERLAAVGLHAFEVGNTITRKTLLPAVLKCLHPDVSD